MSNELLQIDKENSLLLLSPFKDAQEAIGYILSTRPKLASEIIPWLKSGKYYFLIMTDENLQLLKAHKDIIAYQAFLHDQLPGLF